MADVVNPAATGGAGTHFEHRVDAFFLGLFLTRGIPPFMPQCIIEAVHLQSGHLGWATGSCSGRSTRTGCGGTASCDAGEDRFRTECKRRSVRHDVHSGMAGLHYDRSVSIRHATSLSLSLIRHHKNYSTGYGACWTARGPRWMRRIFCVEWVWTGIGVSRRKITARQFARSWMRQKEIR